MKFKLPACLAILSFVFFDAASARVVYPCSGQPGTFRTNPDNSPGGFVASRATVDASVFISPEASICDRATVIEGAFISDRATIQGRATVRGNVLVNGKAVVSGEAYLINTKGEQMLVSDEAKVYGHAFLNGSVIVSGTSEVYGWAKVLEFAQVLGTSKVCASSIVNSFQTLIDDTTKCPSK